MKKIINLRLTVLIAGLLFSVFAIAQNKPITKKVKFPTGKSSTVVKGTVTGYQIIDYVVDLAESQELKVSLKSASTSLYFNVMEPGEEEVAIYNGSINGNNYTGTTAKSGAYTLRVYLMRSAARRGTKASYSLSIGAK